MLAILYYNLRAHIRQKYHRGGIILMVFLSIVAYVFATLSIADQSKTFRELYLVGGEISLVILGIYYAIVTVQGSQRRKMWHVLSAQGASSKVLLLSSRLSGLVCLGYVFVVAMFGGLVVSLFVGFTLAPGLGLLMLYLAIKIRTIYTFIYVIVFFVRGAFALGVTIVLYLWMYTAESVQVLLQYSDYATTASIVHYARILTPEFVNIGINPVHTQRLSTNIFSIVLYCGIYTLLLVTMLVILYPSIRWK